MKIFIFLLIIAAFLQSSFIPINLVLILLITRSLANSEKENLYAGFLGGILIGLLQIQNIGFWSLLFLIIIKLLHLTKMLPFSKNILTIFLVSILAVVVVHLLESVYFQSQLEVAKIIWEIFLSLPTYFVMLFWEERFVVKSDSRLKLRS